MSKKRSRKRRGCGSTGRARRRLRGRRARLERRLDRDNLGGRGGVPVMAGGNLHYDVAVRDVATKAGGLAVIHKLVTALHLDRAINRAVPLLKIHLPYFESDHVLNIAYTFLAGGRCLDEIEILRLDEAYMDMLGARRIPDPTTAGDFLRRFTARGQVEALMEAMNEARLKVWQRNRHALGRVARLDVDGSIVATLGEKKAGMEMTYKGDWGYIPLLVSLSNTQEPLYLENRPGARPSHDGAPYWIDKAIALCRKAFDDVWVRGDSDFSLTTEFDRWDADRVTFIFGYDAKPNLVELAKGLPTNAWCRLQRPGWGVPVRPERRQRENTKERIVREKGYQNIRLRSEDIAEFSYQPGACDRSYRMVVIRKNLSIERGENALFDDVRYFFYITNQRTLTVESIVCEANDRCNQERLIEQLKGGVHALHNPAHDLMSNWAYMVIASLAWSLKAWFALMLPRKEDRDITLQAEFRSFLNKVMLIPAQVVRTGRRIVVRLLAYTHEARHLLTVLNALRTLHPG